MGLDVYLVRCNNWEKYSEIELRNRALEEEAYTEFASRHPGHYGEWTEEVRALYGEMSKANEKRKNDEMFSAGIVRKEIEMDSEIYPKEHFKIGYFRSSYNDGGINNVANMHGLPGLYDIFSPGEENECGYEVIDWEQAKVNVEDALEKWDAFTNGDKGRYSVIEVGAYGPSEATAHAPAYTPPTTKQAALEMFFNKKSENSRSTYQMESFSCREGFFSLKEPLKIVACLPGSTRFSIAGRENATYLIVDLGPAGYTYYVHSLEIVKETIDYVLSHEDPSEFRFIWSG